jgi:hypothetical protein
LQIKEIKENFKSIKTLYAHQTKLGSQMLMQLPISVCVAKMKWLMTLLFIEKIILT